MRDVKRNLSKEAKLNLPAGSAAGVFGRCCLDVFYILALTIAVSTFIIIGRQIVIMALIVSMFSKAHH